MFERFTDEARCVVLAAQEEAREQHASHIGAQHLVLGAARTPRGVAGSVLASLGLDAQALRSAMAGDDDAAALGEPRHRPRRGPPPRRGSLRRGCARGTPGHRLAPRTPGRRDPLHPGRQEGARAVAARGDPPRRQAHRRRARPARDDARERAGAARRAAPPRPHGGRAPRLAARGDGRAGRGGGMRRDGMRRDGVKRRRDESPIRRARERPGESFGRVSPPARRRRASPVAAERSIASSTRSAESPSSTSRPAAGRRRGPWRRSPRSGGARSGRRRRAGGGRLRRVEKHSTSARRRYQGWRLRPRRCRARRRRGSPRASPSARRA